MTITITKEIIQKICPTATNLDLIVPQLNQYCQQYKIDTPNRVAMFLSQCIHESGGFRFLKEIWGNTKWQLKYENNIGLGNINPGDGKKFMGRGCIQCTGRSNYQSFANWIKDPLIMEQPELLSTKYPVLSAIWFWTINNLNAYADADDIIGCTKRVNGSQMLGLAERMEYYKKGKQLLSQPIPINKTKEKK